MKLNVNLVACPKTKGEKIWTAISIGSGVVSGVSAIIAAVINNKTQKLVQKNNQNNQNIQDIISTTVVETVNLLCANGQDVEQTEGENDEPSEA